MTSSINFLFIYVQALAYMNDEFMFQLFGKYKDLADAVKNPCHLNMAACMLKLNKYEDAIAQCSLVSMSRFPSYASVCERTHLHIYYIHAHDVDRLLS